MHKMFYTVRCHYGGDGPIEVWFEDREEAERFSAKNRADSVVEHYLEGDAIDEAENKVFWSHVNGDGVPVEIA